MLDNAATTRESLDAVGILADGVDALADLGSEDAYELLQEVSRVAAGSDAAFTGRGRNATMVQVVGVLLAAHARAASAERVERHREQLRNAVAEVVEASVKDRDVELVLSQAVRVLSRAMQCQGAAIRAFQPLGAPQDAQPYSASYPASVEDLLTDQALDIASTAARICWDRQTGYLMHLDEPDVEPLTTPWARDLAFDLMRQVGAREMLVAPMGADGQCEGWIALTRSEVHEPFGHDDVEAVMAIGRELGNAVRHARAFRRQQELIAELREVGNHKSWFTAALAHQLRTPLTSIMLHLEELTDGHDLLPAEPDAPDAVPGGLAAIGRSARVMERSVESLLTLARLEEDARRPDELVDLHAVVLACVADNAYTAQAVGVALDTTLVAPAALVSGDRSELEIVVDNLIGNAVKYSPGGGQVRLGLAVEDGEVVLWCSDTGIGMTARDLDLMYTAFHRSPDARQRMIPGSGLGMAIVQAVVARHGGSIDASSVPDRGTRVEVRLPTAES